MSGITLRIPAPLRALTQGRDELRFEATTVRELLGELERAHPGMLARLLDEQGRLRSFVNIYVGDRNVRTLQGLDSALGEGATVSIVPAVAGGTGGAGLRRLAELRRTIPEISPAEAHALAGRGEAVLLDVREPDELAAGMAAGAQALARGYLELHVERLVPGLDTAILVMCATGARSLFAAADLRQLGYLDVRSIGGGFNRWKQEGLPVTVVHGLSASDRERYSRHVLIPEVGEAGQLELLASRVLLVGAGGLGSPAALYLAAAGVGTLGLVDDDVVDRSNLQRQILHTDDRVGRPKVESARQTLLALNPSTQVIGHPVRLARHNVEELFLGYDVIVDGSDNFATRYLVNDACVKLGLPNVHGSVFRFEGQVSVFWPGRRDSPGPCYRCLYPEPPPPELAPSCAEAGVLGVLPGVVGMLEAVETIKILLGIGQPLVSRLLQYDALRASFLELKVERNPDCRYCSDPDAFPGYVDYEQFCTARPQ
jgi:molybdopterin/thiamine biosynthesis adenylyltransferase/rhodanese-related sulfurtransferase/molybdopterin converting factor small subunit